MSTAPLCRNERDHLEACYAALYYLKRFHPYNKENIDALKLEIKKLKKEQNALPRL